MSAPRFLVRTIQWAWWSASLSWWEWALREQQGKDATHPDIPMQVHKIHALRLKLAKVR